ncbi:MAG: hypothetical protein AAF489_08645 [Bacteroidota bacterium]
MNKLKHRFETLFFIFLISILGSCSSDDSNPTNDTQEEPPTNFLLGTWKVRSFTFICESGITKEVLLDGCIAESWDSYELGEDTSNVFQGVYRSEFYGENSEGNCIVISEINGDWFLQGDSLITVRDGTSFTRQIFDLTENSYREMEEIEFYNGTPCSESDPGIRYTNFVKI